MRREHARPRPGWEQTVASQGMCYGTPARMADGSDRPYWDESVHYVFDMDEVLSLEATVEVLHSMCLEAVEQVILLGRYRDFGLPEWTWEHVEKS
ncbi:glutathionylspermidine synthase family protein, partial [Mycolicibacter hiberniae]